MRVLTLYQTGTWGQFLRAGLRCSAETVPVCVLGSSGVRSLQLFARAYAHRASLRNPTPCLFTSRESAESDPERESAESDPEPSS